MEFGTRRPGEHVLLREVHQGEVWTLRPVTVVRDTPELTALYMPHGAIWRGAVDSGGETLRVPWEPWQLSPPKTWYNHVLRLSIPGEAYSVTPAWFSNWRMIYWYINIEEPLTPGPHGFDYMDWTLDAMVSIDLSFHRLKDEDELDEAVRRGVYPPDSPARFREIAARAIERLTSRRPPFDEPWEDWRPDPAWGMPLLSEE